MPPTARKRSRGAATTTIAVEKPRSSGKKQRQNPGQQTNDLQAEPINFGWLSLLRFQGVIDMLILKPF